MIMLDASTTLECILGGAHATADSPITVSYADIGASTVTPATGVGLTNGVTAVTIATAVAGRVIKSLTIANKDTAAIAVTLRYNQSSTFISLFKVTLAVGDVLMYVDRWGFEVCDANGAAKQTTTSSGRLMRAPQVFTNTGTYTIPTGCKAILLEIVGGGGNGGSSTFSSPNGSMGAGGAGGSYLRKYIANPQATAITLTLNSHSGSVGGSITTTINSVAYTANGGNDGASMTASATPGASVGGAGGTATNGDLNVNGAPGDPGIHVAAAVGISGTGAHSFFGTGGLGRSIDSAGNGAGIGSGSAGGCSIASNRTPGAAGNGMIVITEYS